MLVADFFAALATRLNRTYHDITPELTQALRNHAQASKWPKEAWKSVDIEFQDKADSNYPRGYKVVYWRASGDIDAVRNYEYGFGDQEDPNPVMRRFASRIPATASSIFVKHLASGK